MIIRLVKMTFAENEVDEFKRLFELVKDQIVEFDGCSALDLLQDKNDKRIFFTYSKWDDEASLEKYRNSTLFTNTWAKVKLLFVDSPNAWTTKNISTSIDTV